MRSSRQVSGGLFPPADVSVADDRSEADAIVTVLFLGLVIGQVWGDGRVWAWVAASRVKKRGDCEAP